MIAALTGNKYYFLYRLLRFILFASILIAVGVYIHSIYTSLPGQQQTINYLDVLSSLALALIANIFNSLVWLVISGSCGLQVAWDRAICGWFLSRLGRYVPGKVAWFLVRVDNYKNYSVKKVGIASILEICALVGTTSILIFGMAIFFPVGLPEYYRSIFAILSIIIGAMIFTPLLRVLIRWMHIIFGVEELTHYPSLIIRITVVMFGLIAVLLHGASLLLLLQSFTPVSWSFYPTVTVYYFLAGQLGMLAFFAPGGLGVREGALIAMLVPIFPANPVIYSVLGVRLVTITSEILGLTVFKLLMKVRGTADY